MAVKADTSVKWFTSDNPNSPVLSGTAGSLVTLLDACLIDGYDPRAPDSVTVAGEVCTCTFSAGNPFEQHAVIAITGASIAALNAEWRVATSAGSSLTFVCPGVGDGTVSGALSVKRAPAGWAKAFADTNKAAYRSASYAGTQLYLRVDDTGTINAQVRGYEQMTAIDTGSNPFPTFAQKIESAFNWRKSATADAVARQWLVVVDGQLVYFAPIWNASALWDGQHTPFRFGDIRSRVPGDAYHCLISGVASGANPGLEGSTTGIRVGSDSSHGVYVARGVGQTGTAVDTAYACAVGMLGEFGDSPDGALMLCPYAVSSRGAVPGMYAAADRVSGLPFREVLNIDGVPFLRAVGGANEFGADRHIAFDITRPWR